MHLCEENGHKGTIMKNQNHFKTMQKESFKLGFQYVTQFACFDFLPSTSVHLNSGAHLISHMGCKTLGFGLQMKIL